MPVQTPTSDVLKNAFPMKWTRRTLVECGAARNGQEIAALASDNDCWFIEADPDYFRELSRRTRGTRTLHYALTDYDGEIVFQQSSHYGNGSVNYSDIQLRELETYGNKSSPIRVPCISYRSLIDRHIRRPVDCFVLDVEGNEARILKSLEGVPVELLPSIFVVECGYDWNVRLTHLSNLGYRLEFYCFNNAFLTHSRAKLAKDERYVERIKWGRFEWFGQVIYDAEAQSIGAAAFSQT
jgi:FkbM family methyltransferase